MSYTAQISQNMIPLCIYQILLKYSDKNNKLTNEQIIQYLDQEYGVKGLSRQTVSQTINRLKEELFPDDINCQKGRYGGTWINQLFENNELELLISEINSCRYLSGNHSRDLIKKLLTLGNASFRGYSEGNYYIEEKEKKTTNQFVLDNLQQINKAIANKKQIQFKYFRHEGASKEFKFHRNHQVSPYKLFISNGRYYMICVDDDYNNIANYRVDLIKSVEIRDVKCTDIKTIKGWETGLTHKRLRSMLPFMYTDEQVETIFVIEKGLLDQMIDIFGRDIHVEDTVYRGTAKYRIKLTASYTGMKYLALQFLSGMEILKPQKLRMDIAESLQSGLGKYK